MMKSNKGTSIKKPVPMAIMATTDKGKKGRNTKKKQNVYAKVMLRPMNKTR